MPDEPNLCQSGSPQEAEAVRQFEQGTFIPRITVMEGCLDEDWKNRPKEHLRAEG